MRTLAGGCRMRLLDRCRGPSVSSHTAGSGRRHQDRHHAAHRRMARLVQAQRPDRQMGARCTSGGRQHSFIGAGPLGCTSERGCERCVLAFRRSVRFGGRRGLCRVCWSGPPDRHPSDVVAPIGTRGRRDLEPFGDPALGNSVHNRPGRTASRVRPSRQAQTSSRFYRASGS